MIPAGIDDEARAQRIDGARLGRPALPGCCRLKKSSKKSRNGDVGRQVRHLQAGAAPVDLLGGRDVDDGRREPARRDRRPTEAVEAAGPAPATVASEADQGQRPARPRLPPPDPYQSSVHHPHLRHPSIASGLVSAIAVVPQVLIKSRFHDPPSTPRASQTMATPTAIATSPPIRKAVVRKLLHHAIICFRCPGTKA